MSVCFFVPTENASTSQEDGNEQENNQNDKNDPLEQQLNKFWSKVTENIKSATPEDFKTQVLPLARIKKIMKLDEEVKMISAESPVLFAKAAEIFIHELTLRAWAHTEDNKRRTLQRNDVAMAISKSDQFDFLIDIVPRHDVKPIKREDVKCNNTEQVFVPGQPQPVHTTTQQAPQQIVLQSYGQMQSSSSNTTPSTSTTTVQQPVQILQQLLSQNNDVPHMPLQLTQAQLNMIRLQMQNNPNQPIIIQAQPQQTTQMTPQIIQVTSQAQRPPQQVFLAQVATTQEDS